MSQKPWQITVQVTTSDFLQRIKRWVNPSDFIVKQMCKLITAARKEIYLILDPYKRIAHPKKDCWLTDCQHNEERKEITLSSLSSQCRLKLHPLYVIRFVSYLVLPMFWVSLLLLHLPKFLSKPWNQCRLTNRETGCFGAIIPSACVISLLVETRDLSGLLPSC